MISLPTISRRAWMALSFAMFVAGCGGGGGGGGGGSNTRLSVDTSSVESTTTPTDATTSRQIAFSIGEMPKDGVYVGADYSTAALKNVSWVQTGNTTGLLLIEFLPGSVLPDGEYRDTIDVAVCLDDACATHIAGSPVRVSTKLTVASPHTAAVDRSELAVTAASNAGVAPTGSVLLTLAGPAATSPFTVIPEFVSFTGIFNVQMVQVNSMQWRADFAFQAPNSLTPGTYNETIRLKVCYDSACNRPIVGSPFAVAVRYTIDSQAQPEPGLEPLAVRSRAPLAHNVVDAEFSKGLNAVVMVSTLPTNALYIYDVATAVEQRLPLVKAPVAVSLSPDGLSAAVGHDALVTHVALGTVGQATPTTKLLNVSSDVFDLVLDGQGTVHVFPATDQWVSVHSVVVATNTETLQYGPYAGSRARLHPSGSNIYVANNGLSPDDIENYQITGQTVARLGDSPYHGDHPMCGNLWFGEDGARIYTACGRSFQASAVREQDMRYAGTLSLTSDTTFGYRIVSLSTKSSSRELALIEQPWYECQDFAQTPAACTSHLSLYESDFLVLTARYSIPPVAIGNTSHAQRGRFVFHANGGGKVLISQLIGTADTNGAFQLSMLP